MTGPQTEDVAEDLDVAEPKDWEETHLATHPETHGKCVANSDPIRRSDNISFNHDPTQDFLSIFLMFGTLLDLMLVSDGTDTDPIGNQKEEGNARWQCALKKFQVRTV